MSFTVLGISAYYHDAAAALVSDGHILAAAEEERFTRAKHDANLPINAMRYCIGRSDAPIDAVVFYEKPLTTFDRLMSGVFGEGRHSWPLFKSAMPAWLGSKFWIPLHVERALKKLGLSRPPKLEFSEHHLSHAASAFYPSPFNEAAILTIDGVGEWATTSIGYGEDATVSLDRQLDYPHSLGLFYSAATSYCGFRVNSGEYKLMGLAPYGNPEFADVIRNELIELHRDGSFQLNLGYFGFMRGQSMITDSWSTLFGGPKREMEAHLTTRIADVAASFQLVLEEAVLGLADAANRETGSKNLVMAGGVALNCVANGRVSRESKFDRLWVQPASSDAGGALGAALVRYYLGASKKRVVDPVDSMAGSLLGPEFTEAEIASYLASVGAPATTGSRAAVDRQVAEIIAAGNIVAVLRGRMEFGPRALGNRSILADPRSAEMQRDLNLRTKMRESFRPFAPAVLASRANEFFDLKEPSPYMLVVANLATDQLLDPGRPPADLGERIQQTRSTVPAVTHVDNSARVQVVDPVRHSDFHSLLEAFEETTGCPVLINTSFNVRGQPIVCTPQDAYECFMSTGIDYLVLGNHLLAKDAQPPENHRAMSDGDLVMD